MKKRRGTIIWLPGDLIDFVDSVKEKRRDPTRSDTVRFLLLKSLAQLGFLTEEEEKALGFKHV
jgi:metal-responsive CopG/Arc/MetJ family transcriptional regulator